MAMVTPKRYQVYLINLDPTIGSEIKKTRPCLIISPDEMNQHIKTVIIAPMTTKKRNYPTRISIQFQGKTGQVVLDQIRTIDKSRLYKKLGSISTTKAQQISSTLIEMFTH
jgi:mRNA interferase MazF